MASNLGDTCIPKAFVEGDTLLQCKGVTSSFCLKRFLNSVTTRTRNYDNYAVDISKKTKLKLRLILRPLSSMRESKRN